MSNITLDSPSVQTYINNLQAVISRMTANSASCKVWCITLVSAIIVFSTDTKTADSIYAAFVPVILFFILDAYYLGLERSFRVLYNEFISKLHSNTLLTTDIFNLTLTKQHRSNNLKKAFKSISVWPFYFILLVILIALRFCFLNEIAINRLP